MSLPDNGLRPRPPQGEDFWINLLFYALLCGLLLSISLVIVPVAIAAVVTFVIVKITRVRWWLIAIAAYLACSVLIALDLSPFDAIERVFRKADQISDRRGFEVGVRRIWTYKAQWWGRTLSAIPVGVGVGAVIAAVWPNYSPFDPRSVIQKQRRVARSRKAAAKRTRKTPETIKGTAVLGPHAYGDLGRPWVQRRGASNYLCIDPALLGRHLVVVGKPGSGKTTSLLRLAYLAAKVYDWRVYFLDGKGDPATMHEFTSLMLAAGLPGDQVAAFPTQQLDGWRTSDDPYQAYTQLLNRLIGALSFTEPYYRDMTRRSLSRALRGDELPRSSSELLHRLDRVAAAASAELRQEARSAHARYESLFDSFPDLFNGDWSFDDRRAAYVLLKGLSNRDEAQQAAGYIFECFKQFVADMKAPDDKCLLIVDEFPAVTGDSDAAGMIERLRSFGCGVALSSQSYDGLGRDRARIVEAAGALILHRLSDSDDLARLAGTVLDYATTTQIDFLEGGATGRGTVTPEHRFKADPNVIGRQSDGEITVIADRSVGHGFLTRLNAQACAAAATELLQRARSAPRPDDPDDPPSRTQVVELR